MFFESTFSTVPALLAFTASHASRDTIASIPVPTTGASVFKRGTA